MDHRPGAVNRRSVQGPARTAHAPYTALSGLISIGFLNPYLSALPRAVEEQSLGAR